MSEEKTQYEIRTQYPMDAVTRQWIPTKWEPQGEICPKGEFLMSDELTEEDEQDPDKNLILLVNRLEYYRGAINEALRKITPHINQKTKWVSGKKGPKQVYPCMDELIAVLSEMSRDICEYRKELNE